MGDWTGRVGDAREPGRRFWFGYAHTWARGCWLQEGVEIVLARGGGVYLRSRVGERTLGFSRGEGGEKLKKSTKNGTF